MADSRSNLCNKKFGNNTKLGLEVSAFDLLSGVKEVRTQESIFDSMRERSQTYHWHQGKHNRLVGKVTDITERRERNV